jgi:dTDP-4-dehydrorhamnose 3,5-epimerase
VVVDLRPGSPTYLQWQSFDLTGENQVSIYVPAGCAHGFQALAEPSDTSYRIDRAHDPSEDLTIAHDDPELDIPWPLEVTEMSDADGDAPPLAALEEPLRQVRPWTGSPTLSRWLPTTHSVPQHHL